MLRVGGDLGLAQEHEAVEGRAGVFAHQGWVGPRGVRRDEDSLVGAEGVRICSAAELGGETGEEHGVAFCVFGGGLEGWVNAEPAFEVGDNHGEAWEC